MLSPMDPAARLRGGCVGAASGAVSIAAHSLGGGTVAPASPAAALLLATCALVGVLGAALSDARRPGLVRLMLVLAAGQVIGHATLAFSPAPCHAQVFSAGMALAHLVAIPAGALLIRGAEVALGRAISSVRRAVLAFGALIAAPQSVWRLRPAHVVVVPRRLVVSSGFGRRGPPRAVLLESLHRPGRFAFVR